MVIQVSDSASNRNELIENAAKTIGKSEQKRKVFEAIHHGKKSIKAAEDIAAKTNLSTTRVLQIGRELAGKYIIEQTKENGRVAYKKNDFLQQHKKEVLSLAGNRKKLEKYPTKRNPRKHQVLSVSVPVSTADAVQITIDDISNFSKVKKIKGTSEHLPKSLSEKAFKNGVKNIIGEPGRFSDWGGEKNDLLSTRLRINGKRHSVAFAFKGPGTSGTLTPKKMGKNGDQIQRLFQSPADVFIVQYWREIDESILDQVKSLATAKSATSGKKVWFGIIDGYDSRRIYEAYLQYFT